MDGPGNGQDGGAVAGDGGPGDGGVSGSDAVNFFAVGGLVEGHGTEDGGEDHAGRVDVDEVFVKLDAAFGWAFAGDARGFDGVVGGGSIHGDRKGAEGDVDVAASGVAAAVARVGRGERRADAGCGERREGDDAEGLVDFEVVSAAVEPGLGVGIRLGLIRREAEVGEGRWGLRVL